MIAFLQKYGRAALLFAGFIAVAGLSGFLLSPRKIPPPSAISILETLTPGFGPKDYNAALIATRQRLDLAKERVSRDPDQWLYQENFAFAQMAEYRLTGDYENLAAAQRALDTGMASAPKGSGPLLLRAALGVSRHDLAGVPADLAVYNGAVVPLADDERAESAAIMGDVDFYQGRYRSALRHYEKASALSENAGTLFRLGRYYQKMGNPNRAIATFVRAAQVQKDRSPQFLSSVWLQIGAIELERGNWTLAKKYFLRADAIFPGFWLNEAHLAQMKALEGNSGGAILRYQQIAAKAENPEVMDALASLYRHQGNAAQSKIWSDKARTMWAQRLATLPFAALGHAADHEMMFGTPEKALAIARADFAARPHGDASIALARASLANNMIMEAKMILESLTAPPSQDQWRSASQYAALADVYARLNDSDKSTAAQETALAINPKISHPAAPMIWFGHH